MEKLEQLQNILGVHFKNQELLRTALTHRSWLNEHPEYPLQHNERLEFLGDAVLEVVVSEHLYRNFNIPEGEMTGIRAAIVNANSLSKIANNFNLKNYLFLSKGEAKGDERAQKTILANALEAIIGAIYLDGGIKGARDFIKRYILVLLPEILNKGIKDPKSLFQEIAQENFAITPAYKVLEKWGPEHKKRFLVGVYLGKDLLAKGEGFSKQEAEEEAAKKALQALKSKKQNV